MTFGAVLISFECIDSVAKFFYNPSSDKCSDIELQSGVKAWAGMRLSGCECRNASSGLATRNCAGAVLQLKTACVPYRGNLSSTFTGSVSALSDLIPAKDCELTVEGRVKKTLLKMSTKYDQNYYAHFFIFTITLLLQG